MAIEKDSSGVPEVDFKRRTTKVNLSIIVSIGVFYAIAYGALWWFSQNAG